MTSWQLQAAKQRFSEVVRGAESGEPQFITKHGMPVAVLVDMEEYRRTHQERAPFTDFLLAGLDVDDLELPERTAEPDRIADLLRAE